MKEVMEKIRRFFNGLVGAPALAALLICSSALAGVDPANTFKLGDGSESNKIIRGNLGRGNADPKLRYNAGSSRWQFSDDGTTYSDMSASSSGTSSDVFILSGGTTFVSAIDGIRRSETSESISKIVLCMLNSGDSGSTTIQLNYGPALASNTTLSVTANGGLACNSSTPSISLNANDLKSVDVTAVATGAPYGLTVKLYY